MSRFETGKIQCSCGNLVDMQLYHSVNVTVDPNLIPNIISRKINSFYCENCGAESELAFQFLYVDMNRNYWIWVYPEGARKNKEEIKNEINSQAGEMKKLLSGLGASDIEIVFGYDELFEIIDPTLVQYDEDLEEQEWEDEKEEERESINNSEKLEVRYFFSHNVEPFLSKDELVDLYSTAFKEYKTNNFLVAEISFMNDYLTVRKNESISSTEILKQILKIANRRLVQMQKDKGIKDDDIEENILFIEQDTKNKGEDLSEEALVKTIHLSAISSFSFIVKSCPELYDIMKSGNTTFEDWDILMTASGVGFALKTNKNLNKELIIKECNKINPKITHALNFYLDFTKDAPDNQRDSLGAATGIWVIGNLMKSKPDFKTYINSISIVGRYIEKLLS